MATIVPKCLFRAEIDVAFQRSAVADEVVMLRDVGAEGFEALISVKGAVDDEIRGIIAIQHAGQSMVVLPSMDGEGVVLTFRREEDGAMGEYVRRVPVFAAATVGDENRRPVFF